MSNAGDIKDLLPIHALGALDPDEAEMVERAVAADPALAAELEAYRRTATALVAPLAPSPEVEARLLASVGGGRFEAFANRIASLFDVTVDRARELLGLVERAASWEQPVPGVHLIHFQGGPATAAADCGFVKIDPGCTFPWHTHRGEEVSLILAGTLRDRSGRLLRAGDELVQASNTQHDLTAEGDTPVIYVARANNGIEVAQRA